MSPPLKPRLYYIPSKSQMLKEAKEEIKCVLSHVKPNPKEEVKIKFNDGYIAIYNTDIFRDETKPEYRIYYYKFVNNKAYELRIYGYQETNVDFYFANGFSHCLKKINDRMFMENNCHEFKPLEL